MPTPKTELEKKAIDTIRFLAVDAVENANSGHPGMPMGAAPMAYVLWTRHLRFNPKDPRWPNRDRFVLSAGHGSMLLYALLHLGGFDVTLDDLRKFRQLHSKTPGHPEFRDTPGVEATTGPLGQGISNAVGMALSLKMLAARVGDGLIDGYVYGICSDGDLMEGVSAEASSLAGHLQLGNLIFLYDDNRVSLAGHTDVTFTEDRLKRYEAYGWHTQQVDDGNDTEAIDRAIRGAKQQKERPSLIAVRTVIGYGSPNKADTHEAHGSPLGKDEVRLTKQKLGWPLEPTFLVPDEVRASWSARVEELKKTYDAWQQKLAQWRKDPAHARLWDQYVNREVPRDLGERLAKVVANTTAAEATRKVSQAVIQKVAELVPNLVGGSADLDPSTFTYIKDGGDVRPGDYRGRNIHFGVREHGMGAVANGFAYDGFFIPYGATFLLFSDYMRPPIRMAALQRREGPTALVFTRQKLAPLQRATAGDLQKVLRGAYTLVEAQGEPELVIVATGSELPASQAALQFLDAGLRARTRLVSMPCVERFLEWPGDEQRKLLPRGGRAKLVAVEAAGGLDWYRLVGDGLVVGIDRFGASAPEKALAEAYGMTPQKIAGRIGKWVAEGARTNTKG